MKLNFLKPREKFLILELTPTGASGLFMSVDDDRNIIFEKFVDRVPLKKILRSPAQTVTQKSWEGKHLFKSRRRVIAVGEPSVATTIPAPLDLHREKSEGKEAITLAEFENLIAQAMAKIFHQCRIEAARRLRRDELDTILVGAKTSHVKLDGRPITDPVGHPGKKISLLLELIFASRDSFEDLKNFFSSPDEFFFAESPQVRLLALSRVRPLPLNLIVAENTGKTSLFILDKPNASYPVLYRETLDWDSASFLHEIAHALKVTYAAAKELYRAYLDNAVSPRVSREIRRIIEPAEKQFLSELNRAKIKGRVYVDTPHALPFALPHHHAGLIIEPVPLAEITASLGFTIPDEGDRVIASPHLALRYLAPFFEAYFDKSFSEINKKLRRRLHWLAE